MTDNDSRLATIERSSNGYIVWVQTDRTNKAASYIFKNITEALEFMCSYVSDLG